MKPQQVIQSIKRLRL